MIAKQKKWFPVTRGGTYRKWYGNLEEIVFLENDGYTIKHNGKNYRLRDKKYYFRLGLTWTMITSYKFSVRLAQEGILFGNGGPTAFPSQNQLYLLALLNSKVSEYVVSVVNPTINTVISDICLIPVLFDKVNKIEVLTQNCISISKTDWDSFETSWDFTRHPLVTYAALSPKQIRQEENSGFLVMNNLADAYRHWEQVCNDRFQQLKANEEELNRIFIDIYGLQDELTPEVEDKDVTVRLANVQRDVRSLLSYAVGCMFGRYSPYKEGLIYAGGEWDYNQYENMAWLAEGKPDVMEFHKAGTHFFPDQDNIIPICDEEYFADDIVDQFIEFIAVVYGQSTLEENIKFIADALGGKGATPKEVIRNYFLKDFFADHCKIYQKHPIYWLFDSGKQNGFKALVYLHRYTPDTIGKLRVDYLHRLQRVYANEIERMQDMIDNSQNPREVTTSTKRKEKLQKQLKECREYDEKIAHLALARIELDLDDGVKVNYEKVQTAADGKKYQVLGKI